MVCSVCSTVNPEGTAQCVSCKTPFPISPDEMPTSLMEPASADAEETSAMSGSVARV